MQKQPKVSPLVACLYLPYVEPLPARLVVCSLDAANQGLGISKQGSVNLYAEPE